MLGDYLKIAIPRVFHPLSLELAGPRADARAFPWPVFIAIKRLSRSNCGRRGRHPSTKNEPLAGGIRFLSPSAGRRLSRADARLHRANKTDGIAQARTLKNVPQRMFHRIKIETNSPKTHTSKGIQVFHGNCSTAPRKTKSDSAQLIPSARNHDTRSTATA